MADGQTHFLWNVIGGATLTALAIRYLPTDQDWQYVAVGSLIGSIITPDMDLEGRTHTENLMRKIPVVGLLFQFSWYPYAVLTNHRGMSHNLLLGTPSRMLYGLLLLLFWLTFVSGMVYQLGGVPDTLITGIWDFIVQPRGGYLLLAWYAQDIVHYVLDFVIHD